MVEVCVKVGGCRCMWLVGAEVVCKYLVEGPSILLAQLGGAASAALGLSVAAAVVKVLRFVAV